MSIRAECQRNAHCRSLGQQLRCRVRFADRLAPAGGVQLDSGACGSDREERRASRTGNRRFVVRTMAMLLGKVEMSDDAEQASIADAALDGAGL